MPFPVPQPEIRTSGSGKSAAELANEANEHRRAEQIRSALQFQRPVMVTSGAEPSEADLARERNRRLERQGNDAHAYRSQIQAIADERQAVTGRLAYLRSLADAALREGDTARVREYRAKIEDATVLADRLDLIDADARVGLARAERAEVAELESLKAQVPNAEKTLAAWLKARATFAKHAEAIAEIVSAEAEAEAAYRILREAARRLPDREPPAPFPVGIDGRALRISISIPGFVTVPAARPSANDAYAR